MRMMVTAAALAPHPGVAVTAKVSDDRQSGGQQRGMAVVQVEEPERQSYTDIEDADDAAYTADFSGDVGYYLRATVSYDDREAEGQERDGDVSQPGAGDQFAECRS